MKRSSKLFVLLAVFILALGAYFGISHFMPEEDESSSSGSDGSFIQVFNTARESILQISWEYGGSAYVIKRDSSESDWYCPDMPELQINQSYASAMLTDVYSVTAEDVIVPADELSAYGFDEPQADITITLDDNSEYNFIIGDYNSFSESYYMSFNGGDELYLVTYDIASDFSYTIDDMIAEEESESDAGSAASSDSSAQS